MFPESKKEPNLPIETPGVSAREKEGRVKGDTEKWTEIGDKLITKCYAQNCLRNPFPPLPRHSSLSSGQEENRCLFSKDIWRTFLQRTRAISVVVFATPWSLQGHSAHYKVKPRKKKKKVPMCTELPVSFSPASSWNLNRQPPATIIERQPVVWLRKAQLKTKHNRKANSTDNSRERISKWK